MYVPVSPTLNFFVTCLIFEVIFFFKDYSCLVIHIPEATATGLYPPKSFYACVSLISRIESHVLFYKIIYLIQSCHLSFFVLSMSFLVVA